MIKFYHRDRLQRPSDKWVLGNYNLSMLGFDPQVRTSKDVYDKKEDVTKIIDKIVAEVGEQERGWFTELPVDCRILEFYDEDGEIKDE